MIVEAVVLSLILGIIRKGKVMNFAFVDIKWIYLFMVGAVSQAILFNLASEEGVGLGLWLYNNFYMVHLFSYLMILIPLVINFKQEGFQFMAIGTLLNLIAIFTNGAKMPVKVPEGYAEIFDLGHTLMTDTSRFKFLSDFIFVGPPYPMPKVLSIGDLFLIIGVFYFIQHVMTSDYDKDQVLSTGQSLDQ